MRKLFACLLIEVLLTGIFLLLIFKVPQAVQSITYIVYSGLVVTTGFAYIGGNVWAKWVKSKHFQEKLLQK